MDPLGMVPFGEALRAYFEGDTTAELIVRRDDGLEVRVPVAHFFRQAEDFTELENAALEHCEGHILDIGAGTGLHSLTLQSRGHRVTAIDIDRQAVSIMSSRGVEDVRCVDIGGFEGGPFDTMLMLGHGIGMVEDLDGLSRFLLHAAELTRKRGQVLLHSLDVRKTDAAEHLAYHETQRRSGLYVGETRIQFEFEGRAGPWCGWLHVDAETLQEEALSGGWDCEILFTEGGGDYLARLTR
jgi:SAM-dependent methyltransferase